MPQILIKYERLMKTFNKIWCPDKIKMLIKSKSTNDITKQIFDNVKLNIYSYKRHISTISKIDTNVICKSCPNLFESNKNNIYSIKFDKLKLEKTNNYFKKSYDGDL